VQFYPVLSNAQAQLSPMDSCTVQERVVPGSFTSVPLRRRSFLALTHVLYRTGWCLATLYPSVLLRRRSFLSLTVVPYRKGWCLAASSPTAPWRRRSFPSTDTGMQSSFSCPSQVRIFVSFSFLFWIANVLLLKKNLIPF
jgi:hypothetical protein